MLLVKVVDDGDKTVAVKVVVRCEEEMSIVELIGRYWLRQAKLFVAGCTGVGV